MNLYRKRNTKGKVLPSWYCAFRTTNKDGESRQIHRSTGCKTKAEALDRASQIEAAYRQEAGTDSETSALIMEKLQEAGERALKGTLNHEVARSIVSDILEIGTGEQLKEYTTKAWLETWLDEKKDSRTKSTYNRYRTCVRRFLEFLGGRSESRLEAITRRDIQDFRKMILNEGRAASTTNGYVKDLAAIFRSAVREGLIKRSPASNLEGLAEDDSFEREPFTMAEIKEIIKHCPNNEWRGMTLFGLYAGLRIKDAANLIFDSIDLQRGTVTYIPLKTRRTKSKRDKQITAPLHSELISFFEEYPSSDDPKNPIFPSLTGRGTGGTRGLSVTFSEIMENANVSKLEVETAGGKVRSRRSYHSLRHTFISLMANSGVQEELRMKIAGQKNQDVHQIYTHTELETLQNAIESVPSLSQLD